VDPPESDRPLTPETTQAAQVTTKSARCGVAAACRAASLRLLHRLRPPVLRANKILQNNLAGNKALIPDAQNATVLRHF
jgi:hypothetical protein